MKEKNRILNIKYEVIPTKENVDYAFQRLITNLVIATKFKEYQKSWQEFEEILNIVSKWAIIFDKTKILQNIDLNELKYVENKLYDLDGEYLSIDGLYAEDAYIWIGQIQVLVNKSYENKEKM